MDVDEFYNPVEINMKGVVRSILVLSIIAFAEKPVHGYHIIQMIDTKSQGDFKLQSGTLYPILHNLADQGLIDFIDERSRRGPSRKCYYLTDKGNEALTNLDHSVSQILSPFETLRTIKSSYNTQGRERGG